MKQYIRIDILFAITGLAILLVGLLFYQSTIDFQFHSTYVVISHLQIAITVCTLLFFYALWYYVFGLVNKRLNRNLGLIHFFLTVLPMLIILSIILLPNYHQMCEEYVEQREKMNILTGIIVGSALISLLGQLVFVTNIIATLFRNSVTSQNTIG